MSCAPPSLGFGRPAGLCAHFLELVEQDRLADPRSPVMRTCFSVPPAVSWLTMLFRCSSSSSRPVNAGGLAPESGV